MEQAMEPGALRMKIHSQEILLLVCSKLAGVRPQNAKEIPDPSRKRELLKNALETRGIWKRRLRFSVILKTELFIDDDNYASVP